MPEPSIQDVLATHAPRLLAIPGVVGTAVGKAGDALCIRVYLSEDSATIRSQIPEAIEGFAVVAQYTGEFKAL